MLRVKTPVILNKSISQMSSYFVVVVVVVVVRYDLNM